jgi:hypothetical protein
MAGRFTKVGGKVLLELKKHKKTVLAWFGIGAFVDLLRQHYADEIMSWLLRHFGKVGSWLLGNPFALLTIALIVVVAWVLWVALNEAISQSESSLVGPRKEKLYIPRFSTEFIAGVFVVGLCVIIAVAYGAYRYYKTPFPLVVSSSGTWFTENYKGADVYVAVKIKNFGDRSVPVSIETFLTFYGQRPPESFVATDVPSVLNLTIPPGGVETSRPQIWFHGNRSLLNAYHDNQIEVHTIVKYNNGARDVTYTFVGKLDYSTVKYCSRCEGNIDIMKEETS